MNLHFSSNTLLYFFKDYISLYYVFLYRITMNHNVCHPELEHIWEEKDVLLKITPALS